VGRAAEPGEGKRHIARTDELADVSTRFDKAIEILQDELVTEEAMNEGREAALYVRAYQNRLDGVRAALRLFDSAKVVCWVEGEDLWVVPRKPISLFGKGRFPTTLPVIFSSATLAAEYQARILHLPDAKASRVGVPFDLAEQALIYQPEVEGDPIAQTVAVLKATEGRALVLLTSLAEVRRYKEALAPLGLPWELIFEGDGERGAQLERFRSNSHSVLFGATFWEGVDVPGEALSCCVIPRLPFPDHDPLIKERREQAEATGTDPFEAVDVPEMSIKLKQGAGRLIRSAQDRGVLALLDRSYMGQPWEDAVGETLPEEAEQTTDLGRVTGFLSSKLHEPK
jgi:ATP-dependent DNA helicase DinG